MNSAVRVVIASALLVSATAPAWADDTRPAPVSYAPPGDAPTGYRYVKNQNTDTPLLVGIAALAGLGAGALINDNKDNHTTVVLPASP
jgi:hypothetical protein